MVVVAFVGALFVVKPSFNLECMPALLAALGGFSAGTAYTFVRKLGLMGERGSVIVMFFSVFSCIVTMPFMIFDYHPMTKMQFLYLILAGASAAGGQLTVTKAYTKAPAKDISIYDYSQVIFAAILGFIFLGQVPDIYSVIGYIIIIGAAVLKWKYSIKNPV
jgi:drug/metabolite transporter (DMT)-like permease